MKQAEPVEELDVLIVGAGLSGIGAAVHLQRHCPNKRYAIVESRASIGGTWDLFRYPGVRSDSDMYTLGYSFRPWTHEKAIAEGQTILDYVRDTARDYDVDRQIRFRHRVRSAAWSTKDAAWTVELEGPGGEPQRLRCNFLYMCSGYYDYQAGYTPEFAGIERFAGRVVHPQFWTPDIDYTGKRVVVIGSGATAMTLVPELAKRAAHVTMLQRSPTYVISRPAKDPLANLFRKLLPPRAAYAFTRWKNVLLGMLFFQLCKRRPDRVKGWLLQGVRAWLGPDFDVATHFTPRYNPWDQRLCLVPDGDLFLAIRKARATVVTDQIQSFETDGIRLQSGQKLEADLIVTATGLNMRVLGGVEFSVDGKPVDLSRALAYKGSMLSDVPNLAQAGGYTNASWTLKCDLTAEYVCRVLQLMDERRLRQCTPRNRDATVRPEPALDLTSGYVMRALEKLPKQGSKLPWRLHQNYLQDLFTLRWGRIDDGVLQFTNPARAPYDDTSIRPSSLPPRRRQDDYDQPAISAE